MPTTVVNGPIQHGIVAYMPILTEYLHVLWSTNESVVPHQQPEPQYTPPSALCSSKRGELAKLTLCLLLYTDGSKP